jgi:TonB-dependent starch-binding outer membrane protein SusC
MEKINMNGRILHSRFLYKLFFIMRITLILIIATTLTTVASVSYSQTARVSLNLKNVAVKDALKAIENQSEFFFIYNNELIDVNRNVSINAREQQIGQILDALFAGQDIDVTVIDRKIVLAPNDIAKAIQQQRGISGAVTDRTGAPLPGVTVLVKGTTTGTITDANGNFTLGNVPANSTLVFSFVGMRAQEIAVGNQTSINVTLQDETIGIDEVVAIGYGTMKKSDLTSAVTVVEAKDLKRGVQSSPIEMLQGKVPGLNITKSGDPTESPAIVLRGPSTLRGGAAMEPFYVIDGIPGASIDAISPDDIVKVDILRDASSTAIYGSRAANGVIMVTTKRPAAGESYISYSGYTSVETIANTYDMLTAAELRAYLAQANTAPEGDDGVSSTNWQDEVQRNGTSQNHNISMGGSMGKSRYSASLNYFKNDGIIKTTSRERITGRLSVEHQTLKDRAVIGFNLSVAETEDERVFTEVFQNMFKYLPTTPVYRPDGSFSENLAFSMYHNPVGLLNNDILESTTRNILSNVTLKLDIMKGLSYDASVAYQNSSRENRTYHARVSSLKPGMNGIAIREMYANSFKQFENYLNYENTFGEKHDLKVLVGYSWQEDTFGDGFRTANSNFVSDDLLWYNMRLGASPDKLSAVDRYGTTIISTLRMISAYSRINYNYDNRYLLQATVRRDGSSAFGTANQWGTFPSVSAAWRISNESFMQNQQIFSDLKFRAGYGVSGNSLGFDPMIAKLKYGITGVTFVGGNLIQAVGVTQNANPDLKWESTAVTNLGLDFGFMRNRITGTVEVYDKKTTDMILSFPVRTPPYMHSSLLANVGEFSNKGVEFLLEVLAVNKRNFQWRTSFNISHNKNEVVSLSNDFFETPERGIYTGGVGGVGQSGNPTQNIKEGKPLGSFFTRKWAGRDANGVSMFYDANGVPKLAVTTDDFDFVGSAQPKALYGWSNSFTYGNFDLSVFLRGVYGNDILNATLADMNYPTGAARFNIPRFTMDEPIADVNAFFLSDRWIEKGSYLRLDNATMGYTIDLSRLGVKTARVYVTGNNLFVITNYRGIDPEVNMGGVNPGIDTQRTGSGLYPKTRSFMLGLNVNF